MDIEKLRNQIIECRTLEQMITVWGILKGMGEGMFRPVFNYTDAINLKYSRTHKLWHADKVYGPTLYYQDFIAEFDKTEIDRKVLREQIIGPFKDLGEMKDTWNFLRSIGEASGSCRFNYSPKQQFGFKHGWGWGATNHEATMTPQQLRDFVTSGRVEEVYIEDSIEPEPTHNCALYWYASLGCCIECNKDLNPRNKKDLYGILDEERRHKEFIAEVKRGR